MSGREFNLAYAVAEGLKSLIIGLVIVFLALLIIMLCIKLLKYIGAEKKPVPAAAPKGQIAEKKAVAVPPSVSQPALNGADSLELIAVLTAAVAASLDVPQEQIMIKSIKRVSSPWAVAARHEYHRGIY